MQTQYMTAYVQCRPSIWLPTFNSDPVYDCLRTMQTQYMTAYVQFTPSIWLPTYNSDPVYDCLRTIQTQYMTAYVQFKPSTDHLCAIKIRYMITYIQCRPGIPIHHYSSNPHILRTAWLGDFALQCATDTSYPDCVPLILLLEGIESNNVAQWRR
jgi:hypothetical protein